MRHFCELGVKPQNVQIERDSYKSYSGPWLDNQVMFIPSWRPASATPSQNYRSEQDVELLKQEVHHLTTQTDRLKDRAALSAAVTTTAGLATLAGGAMSLLPLTESLGLGVAGVAGMALVGGIGLCLHTNSQLKSSESERRAVAGELFETRRAVKQERVRSLFSG